MLAAQEPPQWTGDLEDDCSARWAGFLLRAELMGDNDWWWCVYADGTHEPIASSGDDRGPVSTGESARRSAENAVRRLLGLRA